MEVFRDQRGMPTHVLEVDDFKYELKNALVGLGGHYICLFVNCVTARRLCATNVFTLCSEQRWA